MIHQIRQDELPTPLQSLIDAALRGETVFITRGDQNVAQLTPLAAAPRPRQAGSARGLVTLAPDFDAPLADLAEYQP